MTLSATGGRRGGGTAATTRPPGRHVGPLGGARTGPGRPALFEPDPPTLPIPVQLAAPTSMMTWAPPRLPEADTSDAGSPSPEVLERGANADDTVAPTVWRAYRWWLVAVGIGVLAVALSVAVLGIYAGRYGTQPAGGATAGSVLVELLVLGGALVLIRRMRSGEDWSRTVLALVGGVLALLLGLYGIGQFSFGTSLMSAFRSVTATLRVLQAAAMAAAIWAMFQPGADDYFDQRRRGE